MAEEGTEQQTDGSDVSRETDNNDWYGTIPEQYRQAVEKAGIGSFDDLVKNWNDSQRYVGNSIRIPTEEAGEDQRNEFYSKLEKVPGVVRLPDPDAEGEVLDQFYNRLGRPESADKYRAEDIEGFEDDPSTLARFKEIAHKTGMNQKQFGEVRRMLAEAAMSERGSNVEAVEAADKALKAEWGEAFNHKQGVARGAMRELMGDDEYKFFVDSGLIEHPTMLKAFAKLGDMLGEPQSESPSSSSYKTPADLTMEIEDIRNRPEYWDSSLPGHAAAVKRVNELTMRKNAIKV